MVEVGNEKQAIEPDVDVKLSEDMSTNGIHNDIDSNIDDQESTYQNIGLSDGANNGKTESRNGVALGEDETSLVALPDGEGIELSNLRDRDNKDESVSIGSTDAVIETTNEQLNKISPPQHNLTEADLNSELASFMEACQRGLYETVKELISTGKVKANDTFSDGVTGLHWAAINNRLSIVKFLNENEVSKADPNRQGGELQATPLHWACRNGLVYIVDYLLTRTEADPRLRDSQSYNALHLAVHSSNITLVLYIILTCCCDTENPKSIYIDEPDSFNRTSLHWASYQGDILTINALLRFGADLNKVDNSLFIPIHWAFMKGHKVVLKRLVEAGSDIFVKNDQGKTTFDIAQDMNCSKTWESVLKECGRDKRSNWSEKQHVLNAKSGQLITFFAPYFLLPLMFKIFSFNEGYFIPKFVFGIAVFSLGVMFLSSFVIPSYIKGSKSIPKSPLLAGIFSATAFWDVILWLYNILPNMELKTFFPNVLIATAIATFAWAFTKSMFINPGLVPIPSDNKVILEMARNLIAIGKFDTDHFCVNSFVRKPLRSKYSRVTKRLVARSDHYCPWVYNEIGVRNHKLFMTFVYSLTVAIIFFVHLSIRFFDKIEDGYSSDDESSECFLLSDELCVGYRKHSFHFNFLFWTLIQFTWIIFLNISQTFQILKGVTTWEFMQLNNQLAEGSNNHSTLPSDFGVAPTSSAIQHSHGNGLRTIFKMIGLDQFILTVQLSLRSLISRTSSDQTANYDSLNTFNIPTDYGWKQNWLDFWFLGEFKLRNLFYLPIEGENNLNGQVVNYYKLYELPPKTSNAMV